MSSWTRMKLRVETRAAWRGGGVPQRARAVPTHPTDTRLTTLPAYAAARPLAWPQEPRARRRD